jgi:hypothetical protein
MVSEAPPLAIIEHSKMEDGPLPAEEELKRQVVDCGGPCRGRTYGPLIKNEQEGMSQVVEYLGHPLVIAA